jgi:hypothetical protein
MATQTPTRERRARRAAPQPGMTSVEPEHPKVVDTGTTDAPRRERDDRGRLLKVRDRLFRRV